MFMQTIASKNENEHGSTFTKFDKQQNKTKKRDTPPLIPKAKATTKHCIKWNAAHKWLTTQLRKLNSNQKVQSLKETKTNLTFFVWLKIKVMH
eukprot:TRINITY_DN92693_c0_g1_i1.p1 TRINITY_DN92693_c0_g1~~TRINITY_DN92693_c0_g1_i1.p1  ORF type:complete len:102 (+),score=17.54 TRINITY_DN92693_c0_g1_i1:29-307(+)